MKLNIKIKLLNNKALVKPVISEKGDWIDLRAAEKIELKKPYANILHKTVKGSYRDVEFDTYLLKLGIAVELPKGFEAIIVPRSSSFKTYGFVQSNSIGVIDFLYKGNNDEWRLPIVAFKDSNIAEGDRVCQFRIQLSQKATIWQKLKWLFSSGIKITYVDSLSDSDRGGFGSTGKN